MSSNIHVPVLILDGGMGTTLESSGVHFIGTLWGSSANLTNTKAVIDTHLAFLRVGADIILSNTYQASFETALKTGLVQSEIPDFLRAGIDLAATARRTYLQGQSGFGNRRPPLIALSLGPYGATLPSAAEFTGLYPPLRFGPGHDRSQETTTSLDLFSATEQTLNTDDIHLISSSNTFFTTPVSGEDRHSPEYLAYEASIEALAKWHLTRCLVYASRVETWSEIGYLAFETVPLIREAKAIRQAISDLYTTTLDDSGKIEPKPWWISFTFPDGELPEESYVGGPKLQAKDIIDALFEEKGGGSSGKQAPPPTAIGINCIAPSYLPTVLAQLSFALKQHKKVMQSSRESRPWLVLYPNAGFWYDTKKKTWHKLETGFIVNNEDNKSTRGWAEEVTKVIEPYISASDSDSPFGGFIIGGCCQTKPDDIGKLRGLFPSS